MSEYEYKIKEVNGTFSVLRKRTSGHNRPSWLARRGTMGWTFTECMAMSTFSSKGEASEALRMALNDEENYAHDRAEENALKEW